MPRYAYMSIISDHFDDRCLFRLISMSVCRSQSRNSFYSTYVSLLSDNDEDRDDDADENIQAAVQYSLAAARCV